MYFSQLPIVAYAYLLLDVNANPEDDGDRASNQVNDLMVIIAAMVVMILFTILLFTHIRLNYRRKIAQSFNIPFLLDNKLKTKFFPGSNSSLHFDASRLETLVKFSCGFPLCLPFVIMALFFHPASS